MSRDDRGEIDAQTFRGRDLMPDWKSHRFEVSRSFNFKASNG